MIKIKERLISAPTFEDWKRYALTLDFLEGKDQWKIINRSTLYEYERIEARYKNLKTLRENNDIKGLMHRLRSELLKNLGGIANPDLYNQCQFGTKRLVEKYHNEVIECIRMIYYYKGKKLSIPKKLEFFSETRHSYGRTALLLSGNENLNQVGLMGFRWSYARKVSHRGA